MPPVPLHAHIQKTERGRKPPFTSLLCRRFLVLDQANPTQSREPQETEAEQREGHRLRRLPGRLGRGQDLEIAYEVRANDVSGQDLVAGGEACSRQIRARRDGIVVHLEEIDRVCAVEAEREERRSPTATLCHGFAKAGYERKEMAQAAV